MFSYFIPISLLVIAAFTLGLLVGRLAWASSKSATDRQPKEPSDPDEPTVSDETAEVVSIGSLPAHGTTQDLPVWRMTEVGTAPGQAASSSAVDVDADIDLRPDDEADVLEPNQSADEISRSDDLADGFDRYLSTP